MPLNLPKIYHQLLEIVHLTEEQRTASLLGIFKRDIENNASLRFRENKVFPVKGEEPAMQILFKHLTCQEITVEENSNTYKKRVFEMDRSVRLHWIRHHIEEQSPGSLEIFSVQERDQKKRKDIIRTYIYDKVQKYIVVLEPQRKPNSYYLLTAYHVNRPEGVKSLEKKLKKRMPDIC